MSSPSTELASARSTGIWSWLFQRISGLLLIFLLAVHIWMGHFSGLPNVLSGRQQELVLYDIVKLRLAQGLFIFVDFSLLALVLFHGLNGIRNILLEWGPAARRQKQVTTGLWALGVLTFCYGSWVLLQFII